MENSELERIVADKVKMALELKIDEKASEIVNSLGRNKNKEWTCKSLFEKSMFWMRKKRWHYEKGIRIFTEDYHHDKENNERYDQQSVEIYLYAKKKILHILPIKTKSLVYYHETHFLSRYKEKREREVYGVAHMLPVFREEDKWLGILEMLYKKALSAGVEKELNKIESETNKRGEELKERFGIQ